MINQPVHLVEHRVKGKVKETIVAFPGLSQVYWARLILSTQIG